jgi:hypothetical protein
MAVPRIDVARTGAAHTSATNGHPPEGQLRSKNRAAGSGTATRGAGWPQGVPSGRSASSVPSRSPRQRAVSSAEARRRRRPAHRGTAPPAGRSGAVGTGGPAAGLFVAALGWVFGSVVARRRPQLTDNGSCYTSQPHPARRMGLRPPLHQRDATARPSTSGSTPTITTAATPRSRAYHPPAAYPTSRDRTPRNRILRPDRAVTGITRAPAREVGAPAPAR